MAFPETAKKVLVIIAIVFLGLSTVLYIPGVNTSWAAFSLAMGLFLLALIASVDVFNKT